MFETILKPPIILGFSGTGAALFSMVTQSDIALWVAMGMGIGSIYSTVIALSERRKKGLIETDALRKAAEAQAEKARIENEYLEREAILRDANKDIEAGRREIHELRDQLQLKTVEYLSEIQQLKTALAVWQSSHAVAKTDAQVSVVNVPVPTEPEPAAGPAGGIYPTVSTPPRPFPGVKS